jgi:hypothetical protein
VLQSLHPLLEYSRSFAQFRCNMSFIDAVVARYWLMMLGWRIVGMHFFSAHRRGVEDKEFLFRDYQNMSKTMLALSNAVGELIMSGRDVVKVFAYAEKLSQFEETLDELIRRSDAAAAESSAVSSIERSGAEATPLCGEAGRESSTLARPVCALPSAPSFPELCKIDSSRTSTSSDADSIILDNVSIVPPNGGAPLHTGLNINFHRYALSGPSANGIRPASCERSPSFRYLPRADVIFPVQAHAYGDHGRERRGQELAAARAGGHLASGVRARAAAPAQGGILPWDCVRFCKGKPNAGAVPAADAIYDYGHAASAGTYTTLAPLRGSLNMTLRCLILLSSPQIVYPEVLSSDADHADLDRVLLGILSKVHLGHLMQPGLNLNDSPASPAGSRQQAGAYTLDTVVDWGEVLSGGEKQRLSLARYNPSFLHFL